MKLYNDKNYKFEISQNFYSNVYYDWKKTSKAFNKFFIFENQKAKEQK